MRIFPFVFLLSMSLTLPLQALEIPKQELRSFTANVGDIRVNSLLEESKIVNNKVTVKVPCIIFKNPLEISDVRKAGIFGRSEIDKIIAYQKALIEGSVETLIASWEPNERKEKTKFLGNKEFLIKSRKYYQEHHGLTIVGLVFQKKTTSVLMKLGDYVQSATLVNKGGKLYLTDYPSDDLELAIVEAALSKEGGIYFLEQTTGGEVIKYSSGRKGEKLQMLKNPEFRKVGEGDKAVALPYTPKTPIWQDVPDGTYKTVTMGITYIVKDSKTVQVLDRNGRDTSR